MYSFFDTIPALDRWKEMVKQYCDVHANIIIVIMIIPRTIFIVLSS